MPLFSESTNTQAFAKIGLFGFAGSGKTRTGSEIAIGLHQVLKQKGLKGGEHPVFFLDTETGSDFVKPLFVKAGIKLHVAKTRSFSDLCPAILEVAKINGIILIDSLSHFWRELMETYAKEKKRVKGLTFQDWGVLKGPRLWGRFTDLLVNSPAHMIVCGRANFEYDHFENEDGKKEIEKSGIKMAAEKEAGYEPNILILMERHQDISTDPISVWRTAVVLKDRTDLLDGRVFKNPTFKDFKPHIDFLNLGGTHLGVDTTRTSSEDIPHDDRGWAYEQQQKTIALEEIEGVMVKHYPGQSAEHKARKRELLEKHAGTLSWSAVEGMSLSQVKSIRNSLFTELEGIPQPPVAKPETPQVVVPPEPTNGAVALPDAVIDELAQAQSIVAVGKIKTTSPTKYNLSEQQKALLEEFCCQRVEQIREKRNQPEDLQAAAGAA